MQKQLAFEKAKMEESFSIKLACIAADAKAERLAEKQESQEFVKVQVAKK